MGAQGVYLLGIGAQAFAAQYQRSTDSICISFRRRLWFENRFNTLADIGLGHKGRGDGCDDCAAQGTARHGIGPSQITGPRVGNSAQHHYSSSLLRLAQSPCHRHSTAKGVAHHDGPLDPDNCSGLLQQLCLFYRGFGTGVPWSRLIRQPTGPAQTRPVKHDDAVAAGHAVGEIKSPVAHIAACPVQKHQIRPAACDKDMDGCAVHINDAALRGVGSARGSLSHASAPLHNNDKRQNKSGEKKHASDRFFQCHKALIDKFPESSFRIANARGCAID